MDGSALTSTTSSMRRGSTLVLDDVSMSVCGRASDGSCSAPTAAARRRCSASPPSYDHPTSGVVEVLGERLGRTDVRELRRRVGYASAALADQLRPTSRVLDVVRTARFAALEPWWHRYTAADDERGPRVPGPDGRRRASPSRTFGTLSSGERQRVLLARTLMNDPAVVLLDEPSARLDLGGREQLVPALDDLAGDPAAPPSVVVTHHVDDIPHEHDPRAAPARGPGARRGPIDDVLDAAALSECFGLALALERRADGRFSAWARR